MNEMMPPGDPASNETSQTPPAPSAPLTPPVQPPMPAPIPPVAMPPAHRAKTNVPFFLLGIGTTLVLLVLSGLVTYLPATFVAALPSLPFLGFVVFLVLFLNGKKSGNVRLWSWAKGAMWGYASLALLLLLLFGTCVVGGFNA